MDCDHIDKIPAHFDRIVAMSATRELVGADGRPVGFALCGGVGTGKTLRMEFMARHMSIHMCSANEIFNLLARTKSSEYRSEVIRTDYRSNFETSIRYYDLIIDDIGTEPPFHMDYGTQRDIMAEVLEERYLAFTRHNALTYVTTNLTRQEIEARYGERIASRMEQMMYFVTLPGEDRRRRRH